jgi:23S rRNA (cytidine1920-2'-O)/16S rRNA (cytidine1409-2'-O)-methyltransferase
VPRTRLDQLLVARGLAESRSRAQALILAGQVRVNGEVQSKAGTPIDESSNITVDAPLPYVSRGGYKLAHALDTFGVQPAGLLALDVGASTGGFSDVLLQRGARRVYAVDVGYGVLDWRLRQDRRVTALERTNIRSLERLPPAPDDEPPSGDTPDDTPRAQCATIDVSFISLGLVLPAVLPLLTPDAWLVALVKPQFEAGREQVGKGGVVRDPAVHRAVLRAVLAAAAELALLPCGLTRSPITGPAGNVEFLLWLQRDPPPGGALAVEEALRAAIAPTGSAQT